MSDDDTTLSRRTAVKTLGAIGALGAGTGAVALFGAEPATAASFTISDPSAITTDDGSIDFVRLQAGHKATWDGFDTAVHKARYIDRVTIRPSDENQTYTVNDTTSDDLSNWSGQGDANGWGGDDEYTSGVGKAGYVHAGVDWNIVGASDETRPPAEGGARSIEDPAPATDLLEPDTDGATKKSTVVFEKRVRFYDASGNPLTGPNGPYDDAVVSDDFLVEVTNESASVGASGSGSTGLGGTNQEP